MTRILLPVAYWLGQRASIVLLVLVACYFAIDLIVHPTEDTTAVTNIAATIVGSLAALTFGYARALAPGDPDHTEIVHAGECLALATVLLITATALKYVALSLLQFEKDAAGLWAGVLQVLCWPPIVCSTASYMVSMVPAYQGLSALTEVLWKRLRARA